MEKKPMRAVRCKNGDWFDLSTYDRCPVCGEEPYGSVGRADKKRRWFWQKKKKCQPPVPAPKPISPAPIPEPTPHVLTIRCEKCGYNLSTGALFCGRCGARIDDGTLPIYDDITQAMRTEKNKKESDDVTQALFQSDRKDEDDTIAWFETKNRQESDDETQAFFQSNCNDGDDITQALFEVGNRSDADNLTQASYQTDIKYEDDTTQALFEVKSPQESDDLTQASFQTDTKFEDDTTQAVFMKNTSEKIVPNENREDDRKSIVAPSNRSNPVVGCLVAIKGMHAGKSFSIFPGKCSIGRNETNKIVLNGDKSVSREQHAWIIFEPRSGEFLLLPGMQSGLTYHNGQNIMQAVALVNRDTIEIGSNTFTFLDLYNEKNN